MAKLKVFTWSDGFHDYTVATTSRAKALAAWGVARDMFTDGDAREINDGPDYDAALGTPGETVRRGRGVETGKISRVAKPRASNKADVERVARLERELADLSASHADAAAEFEDRRKRLEDEQAESDRLLGEASRNLSKRLDAARGKLGK